MRPSRSIGWAGIAAAGLCLLILGSDAEGAKGAKKRRRASAPDPDAVSERLPALRLSDDHAYDGQPAAAEDADGALWTAWVSYDGKGGEHLVARRVMDGKASDPVVLTPEAGQYVRPVMAACGSDLWCIWTRTEPDRVASIWYARWHAGAWCAPQRLLPDETRAHQNPELAAAGGRLAVAYQVHHGKDYDIHLSLWDGKAWAEPVVLSGPETSDWDPAIAFAGSGALHVAWSGFRDGDYDIYWYVGGKTVRLSGRGDYDLHPALAAGPGGEIWAVWDAIRVPSHGFSGRTTITGANLKGLQDDDHGKKGATAWVEARCLAGGAVRIPGNPREEIRAPEGMMLGHGALPRVAVGPRGEPWVFYRALRQTEGKGYFWELAGAAFSEGRWGEATCFQDADGYLEEVAAVPGRDGIRVVYAGEHRESTEGSRRKPGPGAGDHHEDFDRATGWKGDVHLADVAAAGAGPDPAALPEEKSPHDEAREARFSRFPEPLAVERGGVHWRLLWGDTHRHSNVSRCSQGREPTPDDIYRYGTDVCLYDFFALSDHAEHPAQGQEAVIDAYWWKQRKLADLYHVPGAMSVLYNYEWSLLFPHGHHNTLFPGRPAIRLSRSLAGSDTLKGGWDALAKAGARAITIPHTGADPKMGTAWEIQDDRYQRVCEIFQACRGSYEHAGCPREFKETSNKAGFYWNALEKGYHVGVIASSDHGYGVAYACVWAAENTREAVWQAMWDRRCYGSTTYGLQLDVHSGEHWMGEAWSQKEAPAIEVDVRAAKPIRSIEILGRSRVLFTQGSLEKPLGKPAVSLVWTDPEWEALDAEQWYYVRVIQEDDEMAWSSPLWVTRARD